MSEKLTVKLVLWRATGYGVVVAYAAASTSTCASAEDFDNATKCREALRQGKRDRKAEFEAVNVAASDVLGDDEAFEAKLLALDDGVVDVTLTPSQFKWLRSKVDAQQERGMFASSRIRLRKSFDSAVEQDRVVGPPLQMPQPAKRAVANNQ